MATSIVGTIEKSIAFENSGSLAQLTSGVADSEEQTLYICNKKPSFGAPIYSIDINTFNNPSVFVPPGSIEPPTAISISADNSTLYVVTEPGKIYAISTSNATITQIADLGRPGWTYCAISKKNPNMLFLIPQSNKFIYKVDIGSGNSTTFSSFHKFPFFVSSIAIAQNEEVIFVSGYSPKDSRIFRLITAQGRWELVAGTGESTRTDGDALKTASIPESLTLDCSEDGQIVYSSGIPSVLGKVQGGMVTTFSNIPCGGFGPLRLLRNINKIVTCQNSYLLNLVK